MNPRGKSPLCGICLDTRLVSKQTQIKKLPLLVPMQWSNRTLASLRAFWVPLALGSSVTSQESDLVLNVQRLQQLGEKFLSPEGALPVAGYDDSWQVEGGVPAHRVSETFGLGHRTKSSKSGRSFFGRKFNFFEVFPLIRDIFFIFGWNSKYSVSNICMGSGF